MTTIANDCTSDDTGQLYNKIAWRLIPLLILIFFFANLDRANVGFAALQMKQELGFSNATYGFGAGIFFLGYFIFAIPSNIALERVGARIWFTRIVLTCGIATAALAFVHDTTLFYVIRFVIGAAGAGAAPGVMLSLSQWVPDNQRGRFNALFWVSVPVAFVMSGPLSGFILTQLDGTLGYSGWRWLFLVEGLLTVAILLGLSNRVQDAPWLIEGEKEAAQEAVLRVTQGANAHTYKDALRKPETLLCCVAYFLLLIGNYWIAFWLPQIIKQSGISDTWTIGWVSSLPWLAAGIAVLFVGPFSDSPGRRKAVRIASVSITAVGFWLSAYFSSSVGLAFEAEAEADARCCRYSCYIGGVLGHRRTNLRGTRRRHRLCDDQLVGKSGRLREPVHARRRDRHDRPHRAWNVLDHSVHHPVRRGDVVRVQEDALLLTIARGNRLPDEK